MNPQTHAVDASECLLRIVESAPQVRRRYQFFLWSQGDLQRWLPHKLLVCGAYDRNVRDLALDVFNSIPLSEGGMQALQNLRDTVLSLAIKSWRQHRMQPCSVDLREVAQPDAALRALIADGYEILLVHGLSRPGRPDEIESLFVFGGPQQAYGHEAHQAIDMLLPCLHMTYQRVHATEVQMSSPSQANGSHAHMGFGASPKAQLITEREREILLWVRDGMSNQQISEKLGISALTVKNHIQKILRKLGAANRAQAVAKAMTMNALGSSNSPYGEACP
jgi:transcriptional regulator EpsA